MMNVEETNPRYQLELYRNAVQAQQEIFDQKWGVLLLTILLLIQTVALLSHGLIIRITYQWKTYRRTGHLLALWSICDGSAIILEMFVLIVSLASSIAHRLEDLGKMVAGLSRTYGTLLAVCWFCAKFHPKTSLRWSFTYCLLLMPTLVFTTIVLHYLFNDQYIVEVYPSSGDIINMSIIMGIVLLFFVYSWTGGGEGGGMSCTYLFVISTTVFFTHLPQVFFIIWRTFILDCSWLAVFRVYCIDFTIDVIRLMGAIFVCILLWKSYGNFCNYRMGNNANEALHLENENNNHITDHDVKV